MSIIYKYLSNISPGPGYKEFWAIHIRLQLAKKVRDLALFNLALNSKLRSFDLVTLRVRDIAHGKQVSKRAMIMQQKTQQPVQFEITEQTRDALANWIEQAALTSEDYLFKSRLKQSPHISTRHYARIVESWIPEIGLNPADYSTHLLRRTNASLIYRSNEEPESCPVTAWSHQTGKHGT